jgi:hypothetical protein
VARRRGVARRGLRAARCAAVPPRPATAGRPSRPAEREQERIALAEERDRALAALKELEFDHRTGKVSDEDYRAQIGPMRRRAAEALRALEPEPRKDRLRAGR